jgi:hypothetical protein
VARELAQNELPFVASARNRTKLDNLVAELRRDFNAEVETRQASVDQSHSLDEMLQGAKVLINCAGPFMDIGAPVVEAAVRNGVHYFDTTGEQGFMRWVQSELAAEAHEKGVVLVPGSAYEYATGNFAAKLAAAKGARKLGICYAVRGMAMSHGTKKSIVRVLSSDGYTFVGGHLERRKPAYRLFDVPLPSGRTVKGAWFPGGESLTVPLFANVKQVESCLAVGETAGKLLKLASPVIEKLAGKVGGVADRVIDFTGGDPHKAGAEPDFVVAAFDPDNAHFYAAITGKDPYDVTARVIVEAARRTADTPPDEGGFTSLPALFNAREFVDAVDLDIVER